MVNDSLRLRPIEILLVEDNPGDVDLTIIALQESKINNNLHVARDGVEALEFLHREAGYEDVPRPDIILLDLNLPRKHGRQVLQEIKEDPDLRRIPVVVLTTSEEEEDVVGTYSHYVNCYINKPVDLEQLITIVKSIESFWFTIVTLPPQ
jgi:two-component system, chemotaxis family, response regulator Rcp1